MLSSKLSKQVYILLNAQKYMLFSVLQYYNEGQILLLADQENKF